MYGWLVNTAIQKDVSRITDIGTMRSVLQKFYKEKHPNESISDVVFKVSGETENRPDSFYSGINTDVIDDISSKNRTVVLGLFNKSKELIGYKEYSGLVFNSLMNVGSSNSKLVKAEDVSGNEISIRISKVSGNRETLTIPASWKEWSLER